MQNAFANSPFTPSKAQMCMMGTLLMDGEPVPYPVRTERGSGIPSFPFNDNPKLELTDTCPDMRYTIRWVCCRNLLIAARPLLVNISYGNLAQAGLVDPTPIELDGMPFHLRLLRAQRFRGQRTEWETILDEAGLQPDEWEDIEVGFWARPSKKLLSPRAPVLYPCRSPSNILPGTVYSRIGWRPVLEIEK